MGKRVYQSDDGSQIFGTRAELDTYENQLLLNAAFDEMGISAPDVITTELADRMTAALRPFVTKRTRGPRKTAEVASANGSKRSRKTEATL